MLDLKGEITAYFARRKFTALTNEAERIPYLFSIEKASDDAFKLFVHVSANRAASAVAQGAEIALACRDNEEVDIEPVALKYALLSNTAKVKEIAWLANNAHRGTRRKAQVTLPEVREVIGASFRMAQRMYKILPYDDMLSFSKAYAESMGRGRLGIIMEETRANRACLEEIKRKGYPQNFYTYF